MRHPRLGPCRTCAGVDLEHLRDRLRDGGLGHEEILLAKLDLYIFARERTCGVICSQHSLLDG